MLVWDEWSDFKYRYICVMALTLPATSDVMNASLGGAVRSARFFSSRYQPDTKPSPE